VTARDIDGDAALDFHPPGRILADAGGERDVVIDRPGDRFGHAHHPQDASTDPATHQRALDRDDGQVLRQRFERGVAARPADAVEHDVALGAGRGEAAHVHAVQKNAMILGLEAVCHEGAIQSLLEQFGDSKAEIADEY
jgi:hypothetical protein